MSDPDASKDYPISYRDYPDDTDYADVNVHGSQGGSQNLPDTENGPDSDRLYGGARTWNPDYDQYG